MVFGNAIKMSADTIRIQFCSLIVFLNAFYAFSSLYLNSLVGWESEEFYLYENDGVTK